ncbi:MAG: sigma-70 family RNA polymerase sigma factor [Planctomycetota bacterium]|nr:sigma-70 family RNA polymerase sigma factor [Planctomycetota bacterium]
MQPQASNDSDLVRETLAGSQLSFQLLVERYQGRLFALARNYSRNAAEVEDIVQDTFLKAFRRLETFQHQSSFSTWLQRIAINTALDLHKRRGRSPVQAVEDPEILSDASPGNFDRRVMAPDARLEQEEIAEVTQQVLEELPDIFRTVLVLREFEDRAYQEIADLLGVSIGTVESRLFRARARFKDALLRLFPEFDPQWNGGESQ